MAASVGRNPEGILKGMEEGDSRFLDQIVDISASFTRNNSDLRSLKLTFYIFVMLQLLLRTKNALKFLIK